MLNDKIDSQSHSAVLSLQNSTVDTQNGRYSITKLPRISNTPSNFSTVFHNEPQSSQSRQPVSMPSLDRSYVNGMENPVGRGPKIYKKNLPDVFTNAHPGSK